LGEAEEAMSADLRFKMEWRRIDVDPGGGTVQASLITGGPIVTLSLHVLLTEESDILDEKS
jgi:hypothetical protein